MLNKLLFAQNDTPESALLAYLKLSRPIYSCILTCLRTGKLKFKSCTTQIRCRMAKRKLKKKYKTLTRTYYYSRLLVDTITAEDSMPWIWQPREKNYYENIVEEPRCDVGLMLKDVALTSRIVQTNSNVTIWMKVSITERYNDQLVNATCMDSITWHCNGWCGRKRECSGMKSVRPYKEYLRMLAIFFVYFPVILIGICHPVTVLHIVFES